MIEGTRDLGASDLHVGMEAAFERTVTAADVDAFAAVSWDRNPLHTDAAYAAGTNYKSRIAHGAFQVAMASALVGMLLPGRRSLITSMNSRFRSPLVFPQGVRVKGTLTAWNPDMASGSVAIELRRGDTQELLSEIDIGIALHDVIGSKPIEKKQKSTAKKRWIGESAILVTGASGGIGAALVRALAETSRVIALTNKSALPADIAANDDVVEVHADLASATWMGDVVRTLDGSMLSAVVHAAWPGMPRGGLLNAPSELLRLQQVFGSTAIVELARLMRETAPKEGGAIVALGSIAGCYAPNIAVASYALGKATLETTVRLLAPELAAKKITINVLAPNTLSLGINKSMSERQRLLEESRIPMGRLCSEQDIIDGVEFLLSPKSRYISGQTIVMSGGQI